MFPNSVRWIFTRTLNSGEVCLQLNGYLASVQRDFMGVDDLVLLCFTMSGTIDENGEW